MNSNVLLALCAVLIASTVVSANRNCYSGTGDNYSKVTCDSSSVNYCSKVTLAGVVKRGCDILNACPNQGDKCANQGSTIGEVCCCDSDNCNAATTTTTSFVLGLVTLAAGLTSCFVRL